MKTVKDIKEKTIESFLINEVGIIYCGKCKFYDKCNSAQMPCLRMEKIKDWHKQRLTSMLDELEKELEHGKYNETGNPAKVYWVVSLDKIRQKISEMQRMSKY